MLTNCPECELKISDQAISCPHCGYPVKALAKPKMQPKKHLRLPNGFGQITKLSSGYNRNPYRAMVTVGKTKEGKPICKILKPKGYFRTYNEAYQALVEYNKNPYDLDSDITVKELYESWTKEYFSSLKNPSSERTIKAAWRYCSDVYNMRVKDIRSRHIKGCMQDGCVINDGIEKKASPDIKKRIKSLFNLMLDYAVEYELVDRNYARTFNISEDIINEYEKSKNAHISFRDEEMDILWKNINTVECVDAVIIQCYMGWRPQELCNLRTENVNINEWYIIGGMKTNAGTNRQVPICEKIKGLVKNKYDEAVASGSEYLLTCTNVKNGKHSKLTYDKYSYRFEKLRDNLNLLPDHRPHDCRKQFITMAKKYNVDEYALKRIVGHEISDITEKIYTDRDFNWLVAEINKIN